MAVRRPHVRLTRDLVLFVLGVVIIVNEVFLNHGEQRPGLIVLAASLVGLPIFLRRNGA